MPPYWLIDCNLPGIPKCPPCPNALPKTTGPPYDSKGEKPRAAGGSRYVPFEKTFLRSPLLEIQQPTPGSHEVSSYIQGWKRNIREAGLTYYHPCYIKEISGKNAPTGNLRDRLHCSRFMFSGSCSCVGLSGSIDPLQAQILVPIWGLRDISSSCLLIMDNGACLSSFYIHFVTIPQGLSLFNLVSLWGPFFKLEYQLQATETTPAIVGNKEGGLW